MSKTPIPAPIPERKIPVTAREALALWDTCEPVPAIEVESNAATQLAIYQVAFELIRIGDAGSREDLDLGGLFAGLTAREIDAAHSIAAVALSKGWAAMLRQHKHDSIAPIEVRKPAPPPAKEEEL